MSKKNKDILKIEDGSTKSVIEKVYELVRDGHRSKEVFAKLCVEFPGMTEEKFLQILEAAYEYAHVSMQKDRDYVFQLHMDRYEKSYLDSIDLTNSWGKPLDPKRDWGKIVAKYKTALVALRQKEKLLGLHDKSIVLEFNEQKAVIVEKEHNRGRLGGVNLDKISMEEKLELLKLLQESRATPIDGVQKLVIKQLKIEINPDTGDRRNVINEKRLEITHDVEFEEMPNEVVSKFLEPEKQKEINIDTGPIVIDEVGDKTGKRIDEVKKQLHEKQLEMFKEVLKKKKGVE